MRRKRQNNWANSLGCTLIVIIVGISLLAWVVWGVIQTNTRMQEIEKGHRELVRETG